MSLPQPVLSRAPNDANMAMHAARTLSEAMDLFSPGPLSGSALEAFFIERQDRPARRRMFVELDDSATKGRQVRMLFTGHSGSGKSTELNKLCLELGNRYFVIRVNMIPLVQPDDLKYVDVLLVALTNLYQSALDTGALTPTVADRVDDVAESVLGFLKERVFGGKPRRPLDSPDMSGKIATALGEFTLRYKSEALTRAEVRQRMEQNVADLLDQIANVAARVHARGDRPVLFVFEDTDKPPPPVAQALFFDHRNVLTSIGASAIYTFPIHLRYHERFKEFKGSFTSEHRLSNMPIYKNQAEPDLMTRTAPTDEVGRRHLMDLLSKRIAPDLIVPDASKLLIEASGGVARDLIQLVYAAALEAKTRGASAIAAEDARYAVNTFEKDFTAALRKEDYMVLAQRYVDKELTGDEELQVLLYMRALIEYENGGLWCDVHPSALALVRERRKQPSISA